MTAPCAMGGALNPATIPRLQCSAVVGSANNQLATEEDAVRLANRGIAYVPDFVVNAGGITSPTGSDGSPIRLYISKYPRVVEPLPICAR